MLDNLKATDILVVEYPERKRKVMNLFTPKGFLRIGGVLLITIGIAGYIVVGPTADKSIFREVWWFDNVENITHILLGMVSFIAAYILPAIAQRKFTLIIGTTALLVGFYNFAGSELLGATLQAPGDLVLHLALGVWAIYATLEKNRSPN